MLDFLFGMIKNKFTFYSLGIFLAVYINYLQLGAQPFIDSYKVIKVCASVVLGKRVIPNIYGSGLGRVIRDAW